MDRARWADWRDWLSGALAGLRGFGEMDGIIIAVSILFFTT